MKKILLSLVIIGLATTVSIGVTRAYFSDQGVSSSNTFSSGKIDLKLSDANETDIDAIDASWLGSNMVPGGNSVSGSVNLKNTGTILGNHIEVTASNSCLVAGMDKYLEITSLFYDGQDILESLTDNNANSWKDLEDLEAQGLDNLPLADFGINHPFTMTVRLRPETGDDYQDQGCDTTLSFILNQDASQ